MVRRDDVDDVNHMGQFVTKPDEIASFFFQLFVVYHMCYMPKTLWLDLWGHFRVP